MFVFIHKNPTTIIQGEWHEHNPYQGRKCCDISAIYRRNIMYWRVSTRYFMKKYRSNDISVFIARNRLFFAIYRWFGDKSVIFLQYIAWSTRVNESQTRYSARQRAIVMRVLQCLHICLLLRGFEPQTPSRLSCPLIHNMQQLYIYLNSLYKENIRIF